MKAWEKVNESSTQVWISQVSSTSEYLALRNVIPGGHDGSYGLDEEGDDVEKYKVKAESPCFQTQDLGAGGKVVHHPAQDHVNICINPERCQLCTHQHLVFNVFLERANVVSPSSKRT